MAANYFLFGEGSVLAKAPTGKDPVLVTARGGTSARLAGQMIAAEKAANAAGFKVTWTNILTRKAIGIARPRAR